MGEVASLPREDPKRRAVEAEIALEGGWAEREWLGILREDEILRLELQRVPLPAGLEGRILALPEEMHAHNRPIRKFRVKAAAAVMILFLGGLIGLNLLRQVKHRQDVAGYVTSLAHLALGNHLHDRHVSIEEGEPRILERKLAGVIPFRVVIPDMGPGFQLVGGSKCSLGGRIVAYTLWRAGEQELSLYQFQPEEFSIPGDVKGTVVSVGDDTGLSVRGEVLVWAEAETGYALAAEKPDVLRWLLPKLEGSR